MKKYFLFFTIILIFSFYGCEKKQKPEQLTKETESVEIQNNLSTDSDGLKLGIMFAKTGIAQEANKHLYNVVRYAVDEINAQGGLLGKEVLINEYDNQSTALGSKIAAEKAVADKVTALIGPVWSSHALTAGPIFQEAGIPMISPTATNPQVTLIGDYIFRMGFLDSVQGRVMAQFAKRDLSINNIVVLTNTSQKFSTHISEVFKTDFKRIGGNILWNGEYIENMSDFSDILEKVKAYKPEAIYLPGYDKDSGLIIRQSRKLGIDAVFLGADGWSTNIYDYSGDQIDGSFSTNHWHKSKNTETSQKFVKNYEASYGGIQVEPISLAYDAAYVLFEAVKICNSYNSREIKDALYKIKDYDAVTGKITFNSFGDPVNKSAIIVKFENDTTTFVKTFLPE